MNTERIAWTGRQSQWQNLGWFVSCLLLIPIPWAIWRWLQVRCQSYTLTDQRLKTTHGILTKVTDDIELYRVRDTRMQQGIWQRVLGLGDVILSTTDASTPEVRLRWLPDAEILREQIRALVEARREAKQVRTLETDDDGLLGR
jgi:uncharacterized membrane protein YdbT with pleckstrin-like domain